MNYRPLILSLTIPLGFLIAAPLSASDLAVVNEQFADGGRAEDAPPQSLKWFYSSKGSSVVGVSMAANQLILSEDRRGAEGLASVVAHFPRQELSEESSIVLSFTFTVEGTLASSYFGLRYGLFDSRGTSNNQFVDDLQDLGGNDSSGYLAAINPSSGQMRVLERRLGLESGDLINLPYESFKKDGGGPYVQLGGAAEGKNALKVGERYRATMKVIRRSARSISVEAVITGEAAGTVGTIDQLDATPSTLVSTFDTVAIGISGKTVNQLSISDLQITHEQ